MPFIRSKPVAASEAAGTLVFLVTLDAPASAEVKVSYQLDNGSAIANNSADFKAQSGVLSFAPGQTSASVTVLLTNNTTAEGTELFWLDLFGPVNATVAERFTPGFIFDDDGSTATPAIAVSDPVVDEGAGTASFFVTLSRPSASAVSVNYSTADDTAKAGQDYTATAGLLSFAAGEMVKTVTVPITDDRIAEVGETFKLVLSNPSQATLAEPFGVAEIGRNDAAPTATPEVLVRGFAVGESDATGSWVVQLSAPPLNSVSVNYQFVNGSAIANNGADFQAQSQTLVFAPGETTKTVSAVITDNTTVEGTETFWLNLSSPVNATIPQAYVESIIVDNDGSTGTPALVLGDVVVDETAGAARFYVMLDKPSASTVSVNYATADDTAFAGQDYRAAAGMLTFLPGEVVKAVTVDLVDDSAAEGAEFFKLVLSGPSQALLSAPFARAEIGRNDAPPTSTPQVLARGFAVGESEGIAHFVIQLSAPSPNSVSVDYQFVNGTAIANNGADFQASAQTLVFAPGETTKVVPAFITDNTSVEGTESFWIQLSGAVNAVIPQPFTEASIFDNDGTTGTPVLVVGDLVVDETKGAARFDVSLDRPSAGTVTVNYSTADDTAQAGQDYRATSGQLTFLPGEVVKTVSVDLFDDNLAETAEAFKLVLSNPSQAVVAAPFARAEIGINDSAATGTPEVLARGFAVGEGDASASFVIQLSAPSQNSVTVSYQFVNGSAIANNGADFQASSQTLIFAPGETTKTVPAFITDNTTLEGTEAFWIQLSGAINATIPQPFTQATIVDNDGTTGTPGLSISDAVVDEADGAARFFVTLDRPSASVVSVGYATADDTAHGAAGVGQDYRAGSGLLTFQPGEMVKTISIDIVDDSLAENNEAFAVLLNSPANATLVDGNGLALISRSDQPALSLPQISALPVVFSEGDALTWFNLQLSAPSNNRVSVSYQFVNGTAIANNGADFQASAQTLVFAPGETSKLIPVVLTDNTAAEADESFSLQLSAAVNATIAQTLTTATIVDDDGTAQVFSYGTSNDLYRVSSSSDRIVERAGGGVDTVLSSIGFTLPDNVENLVLSGTAVSGIGNAGHNIFRGTPAGNTFDGQGGIDTAVFSGTAAVHSISGTLASRNVGSVADGSDTLFSIERLQFNDQIIAYDTSPGGNTWLAYATLNAAFNAGPGVPMLSEWTAKLDRLGNGVDLAQELINTYAPGIDNTSLVSYLWGTIVGGPIPPMALSEFVGLIDNGSFTQASLLAFVSTYELNTAEIVGIIGQPLTLDPAWFPVPGA